MRGSMRTTLALVAAAIVLCIIAWWILSADRDAPGRAPSPRGHVTTIASSQQSNTGTADVTSWPPKDLRGHEEHDEPEEELPSLYESLPPEVEERLRRDLADAARSTIEDLVVGIEAAIGAGDGRDLERRACLLAWRLAQRSDDLRSVEAVLLGESASADLVRTLIFIVGGVHSSDSVRALIRWLDDPRLSGYQADILEALHGFRQSKRSDLEELYRQLAVKADESWPKKFHPGISPSADPTILATTLQHLESKYDATTRRKAARILENLAHAGWTKAKLDAATMSQLTGAFLVLLDPSSEPALHLAAIRYFQTTHHPDAAIMLWREFDQGTPDSKDRPLLAQALARQAVTVEDICRTAERLRNEKMVMVRRCGVGGFPSTEIQGTEAKTSTAQVFAAWGKAEGDEAVRLALVHQLAGLLPESVPFLAWARQDSSSAVREETERVLERWDKFRIR